MSSLSLYFATYIIIQLDPMPKEPLYLVAPSGVFLYLHEYSDIENLGLNDSTRNGVKCILSEVAHFSPSNSSRTFGDQYPWQDISK
jgi:ribonuclease Z